MGLAGHVWVRVCVCGVRVRWLLTAHVQAYVAPDVLNDGVDMELTAVPSLHDAMDTPADDELNAPKVSDYCRLW